MEELMFALASVVKLLLLVRLSTLFTYNKNNRNQEHVEMTRISFDYLRFRK